MLDSSAWLKHIKLIIDGATKMSRVIAMEGRNILVHCSDGWDRTAQLTCLSQIMLDPYYRTIKGFEILIEKEWLSMGFKFEHRCGFLTRSPSSPLQNEKSPIFLQFLDCVWQLMNEYPRDFEFTENFLIDLYRVSQSCEFGTFLGNCERERAVIFFFFFLFFLFFLFFSLFLFFFFLTSTSIIEGFT